MRRNSTNSQSIETGGQFFANGDSISLIQDRDTGELAFVIFDGKNHKVERSFTHERKVFVPPSLDASICRAFTLPSLPVEYGSTEELVAMIQEPLARAGFPEKVVLAATYFALSSWFPEVLPAAPLLILNGPRQEGLLLLQFLRCMVRHALPLAEVTAAGFRSLPMQAQPTLLIDQECPKPSLMRMLTSSNQPGCNLARPGGLTNLYCCKAMYGGMSIGDTRSTDAVIHLDLLPIRGPLPVLHPRDADDLAQRIQPRMLMYRIRHLARVGDSDFDVPRLASEVRVLARVLGACLVDAPALQAGLLTLIKGRVQQAKADRWLDVRCVAIESLLAECHGDQQDRAYVGQLARTAATILKGRGGRETFEPKLMSSLLRSLGFSLKRDAKGFAIRLTDDVRRRIHELGRDFEVAALEDGAARCPLCAELRAARDASEPQSEAPEYELR